MLASADICIFVCVIFSMHLLEQKPAKYLRTEWIGQIFDIRRKEPSLKDLKAPTPSLCLMHILAIAICTMMHSS